MVRAADLTVADVERLLAEHDFLVATVHHLAQIVEIRTGGRHGLPPEVRAFLAAHPVPGRSG